MIRSDSRYIAHLSLYDAWLECDKNVLDAAKYTNVRQDDIKQAIAWVRKKARGISSQNTFDFETGRVVLKNPAHIEEYDRLCINASEGDAYRYARVVTLGLGKGASHRPDVQRK